MTSDTVFHPPTPSLGRPPWRRLTQIGLGLAGALLLVGSALVLGWTLMAGAGQ
jgi:hypothetical protein